MVSTVQLGMTHIWSTNMGTNPNNQNQKKVPSHSPHQQQCINDSLELESPSAQAQIVEERSARTTNVQISRGRRCKACHYWPVRDYVADSVAIPYTTRIMVGRSLSTKNFHSKILDTVLCYISHFKK